MTRTRRRCLKFLPRSCDTFEILTISVLILYLYLGFSLLIFSNGESGPATEVPPKLAPLFKILRSVTTTPIPPPSPSLKCSVTVAIILCEDDRYLSLRNMNVSRTAGRSLAQVPVAKDFTRQINQTLVLLKSTAILTKYDPSASKISPCVQFLILSDKPQHYLKIRQELRRTWSHQFQKLVKVTHVPVHYPEGSAWMRKLFRPCATLRLFLPDLLGPEVDSVIYVDTDIIFLQSVQELWSQFKSLGPSKLASMAPCLFHYGSQANSVPFYGPTGLNAGVMLMNLTRMRQTQWTNRIRIVTSMFQDKIKLADQDILNIYFHFFPEELHPLTCDWNFRPFQCREGSYCTDPELSQGISVLHGNALSFTPQGPEPLFYAAFKAFQRARLDSKFDLRTFTGRIETELVKAEETAYLSTSHCKRYGGLDILLLNRLYGLLEQ